VVSLPGLIPAHIREHASSSTGATIGVLGCRIDVIYPKENKKIFAELEQRGAIISGFAIGTFPRPRNFPIRKQIISGMWLGVVVMEDAQYSGSPIAARLAVEFGRGVYALPGHGIQLTSFGPKQLIQQGAKRVTGWEDVIEELPTPNRAELLPVESANREQRTMLVEQAWEPNERILYDPLDQDEARQVDDVVQNSGLRSSEVLASLFDLELKGVVPQLPGKQFLKVLL
jgi:DNA processing protein